MGLEEQKLKRNWMYNRNLPHRSGLTKDFLRGVNEFLDFATSGASGSEIRCPCFKCDNKKYKDPETIKEHLYMKGFTLDYYYWICHGESINYEELRPTSMHTSSHEIRSHQTRQEEYDNLNPQQRMVFDVAGPDFTPYWAANVASNLNQPSSPTLDENEQSGLPPNIDPSSSSPMGSSDIHQDVDSNQEEDMSNSKKFWDALKSADEPLWPGCKNHTQLSAISRLISIKSEFNLSQACYNSIIQFMGDCLPRGHSLPSNFSETKKLVKELGLPVQKFDVCPKGCMLYWKEDISRDSCKFCGHSRYKPRKGSSLSSHKKLRYLPLIPRLQRLYASRATAEHMRWHGEHKSEEGIMCHPSDSEAWKHFDRTYPEFASEPRNVRLALCADGFAPFGLSGKNYSCWPIIVTPYNLPPSMCLKTPYMFLTTILPGPNNPKKLIDIYIQPLIDELLILWHQGVPTYDVSRNETFRMRASLLWTINDFPAYGMLSGWSTAGLMSCPICVEDIKTLRLKHGRKASWFDCHRRFLPQQRNLSSLS